jgi:hypothetical protein
MDPVQPAEVLVRLTREEVEILLRHCYKAVIKYEQCELLGFPIESCERAETNDRTHRMKEILGDHAASAVMADVEREMRASMGSEVWRIRYHGKKEETHQLVVETEVEMYRVSDKSCDSGPEVAFLRQHPTRVFIDDDGDLWYLMPDPRANNTADRPDLVLAILSPRGQGTYGHPLMPMPVGWFKPYGLGWPYR